MASRAIVEDYDAVRHRVTVIRGTRAGCPRRADPAFPLSQCWCYGAGASGGHLPCPPLPNDDPGQQTDPYAEIAARRREMFPQW